MPTYMSAVPRRTGVALLRRKLQCPLVGAHRLVETTLRNPYIGQGDCATDGVRDVPGPLQTRHAIGIRPVRCLEIPARPGCEPQERRCRSAPEMVVLRYEVERPPGVFHGAGHIAQQPGHVRHGKRRSHPGDGEMPLRPRRPSQPLGRPVAHACLPSCPATVRRPAGGPQRPRARR